ncbi:MULTISPECIES: serine/threonine protein kinase [unclassified Streptomyces]|uniref:serine/threonine protein kinase n=1 Tax=unclassified Streptomyces TaxID=2593676 RepID=UPI002E33E983|nr:MULTISPECIES: serine/threonine protein kinase [unclassified Streptomyces]
MVKVQVSTDESVAGRYRLLEVVHQEEGRESWNGQDVESRRLVTLTRSRCPAHLREEAELRTAVRITRESEALGLVCPGRVAVVVDVVEDDAFLWTVTARPAGVPLSALLAHGPVDHVRTARIGLDLLDVLGAAHQEGFTHGDLSPGHVWVEEFGGLTVGGFGLMGATDSPRVTAPSYASPEQARGEGGGPATDLWALGAIMYEMVEGRPAIRDRGSLEATFRAVERLPIRVPLNAGPLGPAIQGLLRRDPVERVPESVVREALTRILKAELDDSEPTGTLPLFEESGFDGPRPGRVRGRRPVSRPVLLGGALAVTVVCFAGLAMAGGLSDRGTSASGSAPSPSASDRPAGSPAPTAGGTDPRATPSAPASRSSSPSRSASPSPSRTGRQDPPAGFFRFTAPQGFAIDLPKGWAPLRTERSADQSYRVLLGASGDPRTLTVTYSTQLAPDPVAVWNEVDTSLRGESIDYERVGDIRSVDYRGYKGADMEWLSTADGVRERTFGRGFLVDGRRGFSLRWTTPADDWGTAANRQALDTFLRTFTYTSG